MPRDSSGVYTLPAGNPVVTGTIISSTWANPTMADIAAQLNNVLTRDGLLGPVGPFLIQDGTVAAPGIAFNSEPGLGWFRTATGTFAIASAGSQMLTAELNLPLAPVIRFNPRAPGSTSLFLHANQAGNANLSCLQIGSDQTGGYIFSYGANGGSDRRPMSYSATRHDFNVVGGGVTSILSTGILSPVHSLTTGVTDWLQDATNVFFRMTPTWYWAYTKANGDISWIRNGGATNPFTLVANGDVRAGGDLYTGTGANLALIGSVTSAPYLRFATNGWRLQFDTANGNLQYITFAGTPIHTLFSSGNLDIVGPTATKTGAGGWLDRSDRRIKHHVRDYTSGLAQLKTIRPRVYKFREETGRKQDDCIGLIAQEAEDSMPEMVTIRADKLGELAFPDMRTIDITPLTFALINAVKELDVRLNHLEVYPQ